MSTDRPFAETSAEDEVFVRGEFAAFAELVEPTQAALVSGGLEAGARLTHRRHIQQLVAAALVVVALVTGGVLGVRGGLFSQRATPPTGQLTELQPVTPRGLAAAVIAALPSGLEVTANEGLDAKGKAVEADLTVSTGTHSYSIATAVTLPNLLPQTCASMGLQGCRTRTLASGDRLMTFEVDRQDIIATGVVLIEPSQTVMVFAFSTQAVTPRLDMLTTAQLTAIATDRLVGLQTSAAMNTAGLALDDFTQGGDAIGITGGGSSNSSSGSGTAGPVRVSASVRPPASTTH